MNLKNLSFSDLELFVLLGELKSVRSVARERRLNPSQVSKKLRRIEEDAGVKLFKRTALGISLSPEGVEFRQGARAILSQVSLLVTRAGRGGKAELKTFVIGATSLINTHFLPETLARISVDDPRVQFGVIDVPPDQISNLGNKGFIDLAIHWDEHKWPSSWKSYRLGELSYGLYGRKGHPLGSRASEAEVKGYPFLQPVYLQLNSLRFGDDRCPLKSKNRIPGAQTSTAVAAVRIAQFSDQILFVPKIVTQGFELSEIKVSEWDTVMQSVYLSMNTLKLTHSVAEKLREALSKVCLHNI